jgi:hypothetical protein
MRIAGSRPQRKAPETAKNISVGRFRPVAVVCEFVARVRGENPRFREICEPAFGALAAGESNGAPGRDSNLRPPA